MDFSLAERSCSGGVPLLLSSGSGRPCSPPAMARPQLDAEWQRSRLTAVAVAACAALVLLRRQPAPPSPPATVRPRGSFSSSMRRPARPRGSSPMRRPARVPCSLSQMLRCGAVPLSLRCGGAAPSPCPRRRRGAGERSRFPRTLFFSLHSSKTAKC